MFTNKDKLIKGKFKFIKVSFKSNVVRIIITNKSVRRVSMIHKGYGI